MKRFTTIIILIITCCQIAISQKRETAIWTFVSIAKPINEKWSASAQTEIRTGDDNTRLYLWYLDANVKYRFNNWLSANVGFDYIKIHASATAQRGSVWRTDWRPYISGIISWKMGEIRSSLNESFTYNWFPVTSKDGIKINGNGYYLARHRLTLEYPLQETRFTPYIKLEVRQTKKLERIRTSLGSLIKLNSKNSLDIAYIYQDKHNGVKTNALSLGYRIRL